MSEPPDASTLQGDVSGDHSPKYTCAFCGIKVDPFDAIGMVVHGLRECRDRMRAKRDADIVVLADWIERLLTPAVDKTLEDRVREVAMDMVRVKQGLVDGKMR